MAKAITIREAAFSDIRSLTKILADATGQKLAEAEIAVENFFRSHRENKVAGLPAIFRVAATSAGIVGFVYGAGMPKGTSWALDPNVKGYGEIYSINVDPAAQKDGVGRALMTESFSFFQQRHVPGVCLTTEPENEKACGFYRKLGGEEKVETAVSKPRATFTWHI